MGSERPPAQELQILESHYVTEGSTNTEKRVANVDGDTEEEHLPDRVTPALARRIRAMHGVDVEDHGIEVADGA